MYQVSFIRPGFPINQRMSKNTVTGQMSYFMRVVLGYYPVSTITKEYTMTHPSTDVTMTALGIGFTVRVDCVNRECFVSNEALVKLSEHMTLSPMETFCELERNIRGVARRLVQSGVSGTPLQLGPNTFNNANVSLRDRGA
jgi:hypothetical protein